MRTKTFFKALRIPEDILQWIARKQERSGRTFSAEVVYQFYKLMGKL